MEKIQEHEKKQRLRPLKPASDERFEGSGDPMLCTQGVRGSNPLVSTMKGSRLPPGLQSWPLRNFIRFWSADDDLRMHSPFGPIVTRRYFLRYNFCQCIPEWPIG